MRHKRIMQKLIYVLVFLFLILETHSQWQYVSNTFDNKGVYTIDSLGTYLFAGMLDSGVYRSSNNGVNWVQINNGLTNKKVDCFAELGPYIFCGTYGGVFRSTNYGNTWVLIGSSGGQSFLDLLVYQNVIYAARAWGLSRTTNYGLVWEDISTGLPGGADPYCMAIKDSILYTGTNLFGIFKSTNLGSTWTAINSGLGSLMIFDIFFKDQYMFAGTGSNGGIYRSSNGGANWIAVNNGYSANMTLTFCGFENYIYVGSGDGGVWRSSNNGNNWFFYNEGLTATLVRGLKVINGDLWAATYNYGVWKRFLYNPPVGINILNETPRSYSLSQNYPNPFNPVTNISFDLPIESFVKLVVYDALGKEVTILSNQDFKAGSYKVDWDASNYPSGIYFYTLEARDFTITKKMILIK